MKDGIKAKRELLRSWRKRSLRSARDGKRQRSVVTRAWFRNGSTPLTIALYAK